MLKINDWKKVSICEFNKIQHIVKDDKLTDDEKNIKLAAIFCDQNEDDILKLPQEEFNSICQEITTFFNLVPKTSNTISNNIIINGNKYDINKDLKKLSVAQYIDFQNYAKEPENDLKMAKMLSIFILPHKHNYNEEYDIEDVINDINNNLDIITANEISSFFLHLLNRSTIDLLQYYRMMTKMILRKTPKQFRKAHDLLITKMMDFIRGYI